MDLCSKIHRSTRQQDPSATQHNVPLCLDPASFSPVQYIDTCNCSMTTVPLEIFFPFLPLLSPVPELDIAVDSYDSLVTHPLPVFPRFPSWLARSSLLPSAGVLHLTSYLPTPPTSPTRRLRSLFVLRESPRLVGYNNVLISTLLSILIPSRGTWPS